MTPIPAEYRWAHELLVKGFEQRIKQYLTTERIQRKIRQQARNSDELYEAMLGSAAGRKHFLSMMTYWSVGAGIAVSLRSWVEELIAQLVVHERRHSKFGNPIAYAYTLKDLKNFVYTDNPDTIALAGEDDTEHSQNRTWDVKMRTGLVRQADFIVQNLVERHRTRNRADTPARYKEMLRWFQPEAQQKQLFEQAVQARGEGYEKQRLICNLLVLEKPPGGIYAFRFASPRLSAQRDLADEKRNMLLLYGWLRQEKPMRLKADAIEVYWAHLFPRPIAAAQDWYFHENEIKHVHEFWEFVGVPYEVVRSALGAAGDTLGKHIGLLVRRMGFNKIEKQLQNDVKQMTFAAISGR